MKKLRQILAVIFLLSLSSSVFALDIVTEVADSDGEFALNEQLRQLDNHRKTNTTGVSTNTTNIATNAADIATNTADIATNAAAIAAFNNVKITYVQSVTSTTGTTIIPFDDIAPPQKTEGDEYMTLAVTPSSATNYLKIDVLLQCSSDTAGHGTVALFQDDTSSAIAVSQFVLTGSLVPSGNDTHCVPLTYYMVAGTTSETTFKVRAGSDVANNFTVNGEGGGRQYGGVLVSSITIMEFN